MVQHDRAPLRAPEIVIYRDHDDELKRIGLVDDYGRKVEVSIAQLSRLAESAV